MLGFGEKTTLAGLFGMMCAMLGALDGDLELARAIDRLKSNREMEQ
jgi:hypothetical protein